jgi:gliding motility-associated-like protein
MTVGLLSTTTVSCSGGANGSAIVSANGGTSPYTYIWSAPGGTNATATGLSAGTYTCNITDANGCSQTQLATISQPPPITLSVTATPVPCGLANGTASVNAAGGTAPYTYLWLTTPVQSNSQLNNLPVGNYSVIVTDANGCNQIQTVNVPQSNPPPHANFNVTPDVISWLDASVNFINTSSGSSIWAWNFGDGNFSTQQNPFHTYPDTGTYCITLIASDTIGICKDSITKCLPYECVFTFYIPNAFTPNNDGLNELFLGKGTCIQDFNLYVFDRWGNKIFQANDITQGWDGKVQRGLGGKVVQEDVYVWKVYITEYSGKKHSYVGRVSVVK